MPDPDVVELGRYDEFCYCGLDGTSMAAPHVAAAAALLFSQGITDPRAVRAALEQTAERLGGAPPAAATTPSATASSSPRRPCPASASTSARSSRRGRA